MSSDRPDRRPAPADPQPDDALWMAKLDRAVVESATDAVLVLNTRGVIQRANRAAYQVFRAEEGSLVGTNISSLMPEPHRSSHDGYLSCHLQTGRKRVIGTTRELIAMRRDGEEFPIELSVAVAQIDGETYFSGFVRDISERKQLDRRVRQADKFRAVGQLASGLAHELNTPLQAVQINNDFLSETSGELAALAEQLSPMIHGEMARRLSCVERQTIECLADNSVAIARLREVLASLLGLCQSDSESRPSFDLNECVRSVGNATRGHWKSVANLQLCLMPDLPPCVGASAEVGHAIFNLIVNASEAIAKGPAAVPATPGEIVVSTHLAAGRAVLTVLDNGPGIPNDLVDRVFDPFFTTKPEGQGLGQGLSIAYDQLVAKLGGSLDVESTQGQGCRFTASLRLAEDPQSVGELPSVIQAATRIDDENQAYQGAMI